MKKIKSHLNSNGLTLIEVLASMVILSIVIITFLSFFSRSMMFSVKAEDKLTAVNVAEKVLSDVKRNAPGNLEKYKTYVNKDEPFDINLLDDGSPSVNGKNYSPIIKLTATEDEWNLTLIRVHVQILNEDSNPITEIYSYIDIDGIPTVGGD